MMALAVGAVSYLMHIANLVLVICHIMISVLHTCAYVRSCLGDNV